MPDLSGEEGTDDEESHSEEDNHEGEGSLGAVGGVVLEGGVVVGEGVLEDLSLHVSEGCGVVADKQPVQDSNYHFPN